MHRYNKMKEKIFVSKDRSKTSKGRRKSKAELIWVKKTVAIDKIAKFQADINQ